MDKRPRYVQLVQRGDKKYWRYNPPQAAVDAGVVPRTYLPPRKETAFNQAEKYNKILDEYRAKRTDEYLSLAKDKTVNGLVKLYMHSLQFDRLSKTSKNAYTHQLGVICGMKAHGKVIGSSTYNSITTPMAQDIYDQLCKLGIPYANRCLAAIRSVFSYAIRGGHIERNPWRSLSTISEPPRRRVWTDQELNQFLAVAYSDFGTRSIGLIVQMAYEWAQRVGDMRMLTWDTLDLNSGTLTLVQSKRRAQVKIPINADLLEMLKQQKKDFGWQKYVTPNIHAKTEGGFKPYDVYTLSHSARRLMDKAELPDDLRISDLRRTATTEMVEAGVSMAQIMSVTGHANPQSVKPYMKNTLTSSTEACTLRSAHRQKVHTNGS